MSERQLYLLSPYRLPTNHQIYLNEEEMAAWLNGYLALWHPALLWQATQPPRVDSSYDHDLPNAGEIFAVPEAPQLYQPDDWGDRVEQAGALRFRATADRPTTLQELRQAIEAAPAFADETTRRLLDLPMSVIRPFFAIGYGFMLLESLFDAMEHEHQLSVEDFWREVKQALESLLLASGEEGFREGLRLAAQRLVAAREVLYPINIYTVDLCILDPQRLDVPWPAALERGLPLNILAGGQLLQTLAEQEPGRFEQLRAKLSSSDQPPLLEIVGGVFREREDALLPLESQLWNLRKGRTVAKDLLGVDIAVHARKRTAFHPQTPLFLQSTGFQQVLLYNFDSAVIPNYRSTVVNWPSPDGKSVNAFTRMPLPTNQAQTFFNIVYHLHQAITQDTAPTLAFMHQNEPAQPFYEDLVELTLLAPVAGQWITLSRYFADAMVGDYTGAANPDDFFTDYLEERTSAHRPDPVSAFARHLRQRRRIDAIWTLAAMYRGLNASPPSDEEVASVEQIRVMEDQLETQGLDAIPGMETPTEAQIEALEQDWGQRLATRLQVRAAEDEPGFLLLNPCAFTRRIALELEGIQGPLAIDGPIKAAQFDADRARLVVEVPGLGFAWIPRKGKPGTAAPKARIKLADGLMVRNEFFEADIDPETGGLRAFRDTRTRVSRVAQQLVFNPGSRMIARSVQVTMSGSALGEIVADGDLFNEQNEKLATFKQRFRAWLARPVLDIRIEIEPVHQPSGYPWHSYFGARFAWRNEHAPIIRSVHGTGYQTHHTRPVTPDYLEIREGKHNFVLFPGGLPFHQRHGTRMLDIILQPEGEQARVFDVAIAIDRELPAQPALGTVSPIVLVPTRKGMPHIGPSGWLYHLDAPNLMLSSMRPAAGKTRSILATLLETSGFAGSASLRCVRNPVRAALLDGTDSTSMELPVEGDAVQIEYPGNDLLRVCVDFE